tara:strand:- start:233 stop:613 length:381 start_codon:yes stop_codon:yes gene_type:complete
MKKEIISVIILLVLDFLWIGLFMKNRYEKEIKQIQGSSMKVNIVYGFISYTLMVIGLVVFVLPNIRTEHRLLDSLKYGFLFGMVVYGVYDFTAAAVLSKWNMTTSILDVLWGGTVYFLASYIGSYT